MLSFWLKFQQPWTVKFKEVFPQNFFPDVNHRDPVFSVLQTPPGYCAQLPFSQFKHSWLSTEMHFLVCQSCCLSDFFFFFFN